MLMTRLRQGLQLPPTGWTLAGLLAFYVLSGLFGHDPWRGEDAVHLAAASDMLRNGHWLAPELAGHAFDEPPLYYWSAALLGQLFGGWLLPVHDAMRLASGLWLALALTGLYYAGRELHGQNYAAATPLLLASSIGLIVHAHQAQPLLIALASLCGAIGALAAFWRKPWLGALLYGLSLAASLLGTGLAPSLAIIALAPFALLLYPQHARRNLPPLFAALALALALFLPWPMLLAWLQPERFSAWSTGELLLLGANEHPLRSLGVYLAMLSWSAWPSLPIAAWALWKRRRQLAEPAQVLPLAAFAFTLFALCLCYRARELPAILLLPPLALLATPGALSLRRGAANAFDWFGKTTFTLFAAFVWLGWIAMVSGWPARLAHRVVVLEPGFVGTFHPFAFAIALAVTLWWLWLIATSPRSPYRSLAHWSAGLSTLWLLLAMLWLPWLDYGKSYRSVAASLESQLPQSDSGCVAELDLGDTQRASFAYFSELKLIPHRKPASAACRWLLVQTTPRVPEAPLAGWEKIWSGHRQGDRKELFLLYRRMTDEGDSNQGTVVK
jgi:4-amino-4-deoxy-L-arabinose transferase-like glycosyltransferase